MAASNIDELFECWAYSAMQYGASAPFDSYRSLNAMIDTIRDGDAPWQCLAVRGTTDDLSEHAPSWKKQEFAV